MTEQRRPTVPAIGTCSTVGQFRMVSQIPHLLMPTRPLRATKVPDPAGPRMDIVCRGFKMLLERIHNLQGGRRIREEPRLETSDGLIDARCPHFNCCVPGIAGKREQPCRRR